jgi:Ribbon-helix-helix protein, copG family
MPTTIHLPRVLLDALDRKAKALRISRSQLVVRALERELGDSSDWSPGFFERLSERVGDSADIVDEVAREIRKARRRKSAPPL